MFIFPTIFSCFHLDSLFISLLMLIWEEDVCMSRANSCDPGFSAIVKAVR